MLFSEVGPHNISEIEFRIGNLPKQKIAQSCFMIRLPNQSLSTEYLNMVLMQKQTYERLESALMFLEINLNKRSFCTAFELFLANL